LYAGSFLSKNTINSTSTNNYSISSSPGLNASVELTYGLSNKWSISSGLAYANYNETLEGAIYDTTYVPNGFTIEYIYLNPALQDSIIDSIITVNYITEIAESNGSQIINYSAFSLPVYGSFTFLNKGNWNASVLAGLRFNYYKTQVVSTSGGVSEPSLKQFGMSAALRPEITYAFGKFGVGLYLTTSFDLIPITRWTDIDKKRFDFGGGVVLKYRF
jgi:hypothetical protein